MHPARFSRFAFKIRLQDPDHQQGIIRKTRAEVEGKTKDMLLVVSAGCDNSAANDNPYNMQGGLLQNIQQVVGRKYIVFTAPAGCNFEAINTITPRHRSPSMPTPMTLLSI